MTKASGGIRKHKNSRSNSNHNYNVENAFSISKNVYNEMSKTAQGRKELHEMMEKAVTNHFKKLIDGAPANNKEKLNNLLNTLKNKINNMGNGNIFTFLADDHLSEKAFIGYVQDVIKGKIW